MKRVLVLDDDKHRHESFAKNLRGHDVVHAYSADEACAFIVSGERFDVFFLDHDLGDFCDSGTGYGATSVPTGADFARWMRQKMPREKCPSMVWIHSWNPDGAKNMRSHIEQLPVSLVIEPWSTETGK